METSQIINILEISRLVLMFLSLVVAVSATKSLVRHDSYERTHFIKKNVFVLLMWGVLFLVIGSLGSYISSLQGKDYWFWEVFFLLYYLFFLIAFIYFWKSSGDLHRITSREKILFFGAICLVIVILGYFFTTLIFPSSSAKIDLKKITQAAYPLVISFLFLSTYVVHSRVKARIIDRSLWYIASGIFVYFVGYLIYTYVYFSHSTLSFLPIVYTSFFLLSSFYYLIGFLVARKKVILLQIRGRMKR